MDKNRSAILKLAAMAHLARLEREARDRKDIGVINRNAKRLNPEAMDTLRSAVKRAISLPKFTLPHYAGSFLS